MNRRSLFLGVLSAIGLSFARLGKAEPVKKAEPLRVFKVNDFVYVAARNPDEAMRWYREEVSERYSEWDEALPADDGELAGVEFRFAANGWEEAARDTLRNIMNRQLSKGEVAPFQVGLDRRVLDLLRSA